MKNGFGWTTLAHPIVALADNGDDPQVMRKLAGELRSALEDRGVEFSDNDTLTAILKAAVAFVKGENEEATVAASAAGMHLNAAEQAVMSKALSQSGGNYGEAIIAVQRDLIGREKARGYTTKGAVQQLRPKYPNIFA